MNELLEMIQKMQAIVVCVALVSGVIQCFFGYKLFRVMTAIIGFIVGGAIGAAVGFVMAGQGGAILGLLVLGILGAALAYTLYKLGVFVICFGAGAMVGLMLATMMQDSSAIAPLMVICGLILGVIGVILTKPLIILSTGIGGGMSTGFALGTVFEGSATGIILGVILSVLGVLVQFYLETQHTADSASAAASTGGAPGSNGASFSVQNRQPGSPFTVDGAKMLIKADFSNGQALYGAVSYGLVGLVPSGLLSALLPVPVGFIVRIIVILLFAAFGACVGGCASRAGIEYFILGEEAFKSRRVVTCTIIGGVIGLLGALVVVGFGWKIFLVCFYLVFGAALGYVLEMRRRYRETYGNTASSPAPSASASTAAAPNAALSSGTADRPDTTTSFHAPISAVKQDWLWTPGLPIVVTKTSIVPKPEDPTLVSLSLEFQNLSEQPVIAVYFGVKCFNLLNQELEPVEKLTVQDFVLEPGKLWSYTYPRTLPDGDTRRVELVVRHVLMEDGSTWDCEEGRLLTKLEAQPPLQLVPHLAQQFFLACDKWTRRGRPHNLFKYQPQDFEQYWNCACGQMDLGEQCLSCGITRKILFEEFDQDRILESYNLRMKEQRRLEEERRQQIEAQRQAEQEERQRLEEERRKKLEAQKQAMQDNLATARGKAAAGLKWLAEKLDKKP